MNVRRLVRLTALSLAVLIAGPAFGFAEGDPDTGSRAPSLGIVNPGAGPVTLPLRVQVRIISPTSAVGALQPVLEARLYYTATAYVALNRNTAYPNSTTESGIWEGRLTSTQLTAGTTYTLQAAARNAYNTVKPWTYSAAVVIKVNPTGTTGDGNLLVRDNGEQMCSDCHLHEAHSSAAMGDKFGSWYVGCRGCHTPHSTTNASLVSTSIKPPAYFQNIPTSQVVFSRRTGYSGVAGASNPGAASYANSDATGPCQVCHVRTAIFNRNSPTVNTSPTHPADRLTQPCANCHAHKNGLKGSCNTCHGSAANNAPPVVAPTAVNPVANGGAHQAHVTQTSFTDLTIACDECHGAQDGVHPSGATTVGWGSTASANGVALYPPAGNLANVSGWATTPTCTNWCHGQDLPDGAPATKLATWNWSADLNLGCDDCHGAPPVTKMDGVTPHSTSTTCQGCHPGYTLGGLTTPEAKAAHINGTVEGASCDGCHGNPDRIVLGSSSPDVKFAPPKSARLGSTISDATTAAGTGVHQSHVNFDETAATAIANQIACVDCHNVVEASHPLTANGPGHVAFTTAVADKLGTANWNGTSCTTYCHQPSAQAGTLPTPSWATATTVTCSSCHQTNSTLNTGAHEMHVADAGYKGTSFNCATCHSDVNATNDGITVKAQHVNGSPDFISNLGYAAGDCSSNECHSKGTEVANDYVAASWNASDSTDNCKECHGSESGGANSLLGEPGYAAGGYPNADIQNSHAKHIKATDTRAVCYKCHSQTVNASGVIQPGMHLNFAPGKQPEVLAGGVTFTYAADTETCTNISCHGNKTATWGQTLNCYDCHGDVNRTKALTVAGTVDANLKSAPPVDVAGNSTGVRVGAHEAHINGGTYMNNGLACADCHPSGTSHNELRDAAWSTLATGNGAVIPTPAAATGYTAGWESPTPSCTNYCHGATLADGFSPTKVAAVWTNTTAPCGSCHGVPPDNGTGTHNSSMTSCKPCHPAGYSPSTVDKAAHINNQLDAQACTDCHGNAARASTAGVDANYKAAPPKTYGGAISDPVTDVRVGAHEIHVARTDAAALSKPIACSECHFGVSHKDPVASPATVLFGTIAKSNSKTPAAWNRASPTCSSTWCHSLTGATASPDWRSTAGRLTCTSCHATTALATGAHASHVADSPAYKLESYDCSKCHSHATATTLTDKTLHVDGLKQVTATGWTGTACSTNDCHSKGTEDTTGDFVSVNWTGTLANDCKGCHGSENAGANSLLGEPGYASSTVNNNYRNSHAAHVKSGDTRKICYWCHSTTIDVNGNLLPAGHLVGDLNSPEVSAANGSFTWDDATETCSNISCHGGASGTSAQWGQTTNIGCVSCHNGAVTMVRAPLGTQTLSVTRRLIVNEFKQTWSHKHSTNDATPASRTVVDADCVVCHMEGNDPNAATPQTDVPHADGRINLRDPDSGANITNQTFSGTPGTYGQGTTAVSFARFERDLSKTLEADTVDSDGDGVANNVALQAIMVSQCLHCHDSNGANNALGRIGTVGGKPFNTSIAGSGYGGYTGDTACVYTGAMPPADWSSTTTYALDAVSWSGSVIYRSLQASNLNHPPASSPTWWSTSLTAWSSATTYAAGAWVSSGGVNYVSLQGTNTNHSPATSPTWWAAYTSNSASDGCVTNVAKSFATTNTSYHPVLGKQNNWYAKTTRMVAPWNVTRTGTSANITSWGALLTCWDCHADSTVTANNVILTTTVTAHGGATTLRGNATYTGTVTNLTTALVGNMPTLCIRCHSGYDTSTLSSHGNGSAFSTTSNGTMTSFLRYGCNRCHSSGFVTAVIRPVRAIDTHGTSVLPARESALTKTGRWSGGNYGTPLLSDARPYNFIRNLQTFMDHTPRQIGTTQYGQPNGAATDLNTTTYGGGCNHRGGTGEAACTSRWESYTPGGMF